MDLAGSERLSKSKSTDARLEEAKSINKSISALGNCINALVDPKQRSHVPFRDSKLTRVLTNSLSGNAKTTLVACISPSAAQYDESLLTLLFAYRATSVLTHAAVNDEIMFQRRMVVDEDPVLTKRNAQLEASNQALQQQLSDIQCMLSSSQLVSNSSKSRAAVLPRKARTVMLASKTAEKKGGSGTASSSPRRTKGKLASSPSAKAGETIKAMLGTVRGLQAEIAEKVRGKFTQGIELDDPQAEGGESGAGKGGAEGQERGCV